MGRKGKIVGVITLALGLGLAGLTGGWLRVDNTAMAAEGSETTEAENQQEFQASSDVPKDDAPISVWMEKKLKYSQELLRLLAIGDMAELRLTAQRMLLVSKVEGFVRSNDATYTDHLRTFQLANRELMRQAERENIEGATLAFNQLTGSCVACHVSIRQPIKSPQPDQSK